ncbi:hypothetical protein [Calidifontibacillus erzurumensis]|uniref:hypothetical protein n=1 Tax=Calidifontibacillus erzurumensis TaxID=2741433 RepID=UPI001E502393|nr:hypothetical protein [Calidifontibacillus erzurumensis]
MKSFLSLLLALAIFCIFSFEFSASNDEKNVLNPKVIDIKTSPVPMVNQWVTLRQHSNGELLIEVEAINTKEVRFWTVPVKNKSWQDSWEHRKLISIDRDKSDGWSTTFFYGKENLLQFIVVEAIGQNGQSDKRPFYVIYRK